MKQIITFAAILMWYLPSLSQNLLDSIFEDIIKEQVENYGECGGYFEIKKRHDIISSLKYNSCNDTIYMIEEFADDGHFKLSLWSVNDSLTYEYPYGVTKGIRVDENLMELIKKWDTEEITHNRKERPWYYKGGRESITTRIVLRNDSVTFDMIKYWNIGDF